MSSSLTRRSSFFFTSRLSETKTPTSRIKSLLSDFAPSNALALFFPTNVQSLLPSDSDAQQEYTIQHVRRYVCMLLVGVGCLVGEGMAEPLKDPYGVGVIQPGGVGNLKAQFEAAPPFYTSDQEHKYRLTDLIADGVNYMAPGAGNIVRGAANYLYPLSASNPQNPHAQKLVEELIAQQNARHAPSNVQNNAGAPNINVNVTSPAQASSSPSIVPIIVTQKYSLAEIQNLSNKILGLEDVNKIFSLIKEGSDDEIVLHKKRSFWEWVTRVNPTEKVSWKEVARIASRPDNNLPNNVRRLAEKALEKYIVKYNQTKALEEFLKENPMCDTSFATLRSIAQKANKDIATIIVEHNKENSLVRKTFVGTKKLKRLQKKAKINSNDGFLSQNLRNIKKAERKLLGKWWR